MTKKCLNCERSFNADCSKRKYCSHECYVKYYKGKHHPGSFPKGHRPWNKELKGIHLSPKTEYQKGRASENTMKVGSVTIRKTKNKVCRRFIKIAEPNHWINYANHIWISSGGIIPKGFYLHHIDNNPLNDSPENLCLVTRTTHINIHRKDLLNGRTTAVIINPKG